MGINIKLHGMEYRAASPFVIFTVEIHNTCCTVQPFDPLQYRLCVHVVLLRYGNVLTDSIRINKRKWIQINHFVYVSLNLQVSLRETERADVDISWHDTKTSSILGLWVSSQLNYHTQLNDLKIRLLNNACQTPCILRNARRGRVRQWD